MSVLSHFWLYWILSLPRAFCVRWKLQKSKIQSLPSMCLYLVCICVCVCYTYVCACVSMPEGVRVCVYLCVCPEQNWGTVWLPALRSTVHRGSPCWQERIWKGYTDKPVFVLGLDRKGTSVSRNRGEGIFEERKNYLRKGRGRGLYKACAVCSCEWGRGTKWEGLGRRHQRQAGSYIFGRLLTIT